MHPVSAPWKHQKTVRFSDVFKEVEKGCIGNKCVDNDPHGKNRLHTSAHSRDIFRSFDFLNKRTNLASRPTTRRKVLVSSIKGQIWHLDLQQGALLLSEDDSHLILALTKWSLNYLVFLQPMIEVLSSKTLWCFLFVRCQKNVRLIKMIMKLLHRRMVGKSKNKLKVKHLTFEKGFEL